MTEARPRSQTPTLTDSQNTACRLLKLGADCSMLVLFLCGLTGCDPSDFWPKSPPKDPVLEPDELGEVCEYGNCGPSFEDFFDPGTVATIRINIDPQLIEDAGFKRKDWKEFLWSKWKPCPPYDNYVPATVTYKAQKTSEAVTMNKVGLRLRGSDREKDPRPGLKLSFSKLLGDPPPGKKRRRFSDLNRGNLLSLEGDESLMVQCMGYTLLANMGLPAPKCNHVRVYVNDQYYGLMENAEEPDDGRFLRRKFGQNKGVLFEASHGCDFKDHLADLEYKGPNFNDGYHKAYDLVRGDRKVDQEKLIEMTRCGDEEQTPNAQEFRACIGDWIDIDQWLRTIATESAMPMLESFTGARRNYYLYFFLDENAPHGGRFRVWSWDLDHALQRVQCKPSDCDLLTAIPKWWSRTGRRSRLVQRLTNEFRDEYCHALREFQDNVFLEQSVEQMAGHIESSMKYDPHVSFKEWKTEVEIMRKHVTTRRSELEKLIVQICE